MGRKTKGSDKQEVNDKTIIQCSKCEMKGSHYGKCFQDNYLTKIPNFCSSHILSFSERAGWHQDPVEVCCLWRLLNVPQQE